MDIELNEDQIAVRDLVRRVAAERVAPRAAAIDASGEYPQDMFDLLRDLGLFTLPFPAEYGGSDSHLAACIAVEEFGRVCYNTAYLLVVQWLPICGLIAAGSEAQKERYLPGLAAGTLRAAFSTTEPQSGSDVSGIRTRARRDGNGWKLTGQKIWCTNAALADFVVVAARTGEENPGADGRGAGGRGAINFFVVEKGAKGFSVGRKEDKMGARGVPSSPLFFDDVALPAEALLGGEESAAGGRGFKQVMEAFNTSRPMIAARAVGLAQGALDLSIEFLRGRRGFGRALTDFQGLRWMLADMAIAVEAARSLTWKAAAMIDRGVAGPALARAASIAKCFATDAAMRVATDAVQLHGAAGISAEYRIGQYMRDAKVLQIVEGTNQIQRNIIARDLLGPEEKR